MKTICNIIILVYLVLVSITVFAAGKGHLPVGDVTIQLVGGVDSSDNAVFLRVNPTTGALAVEGSLTGSPVPVSYDKNLGASAAKNVKSSQGDIFSFTVINYNASVRYLLIHNKATAPVLTDVPEVPFIIPAGGQIVIGDDFFSKEGMRLTNGIAYCFSTTARTCTPAAAADQDTVVVYK